MYAHYSASSAKNKDIYFNEHLKSMINHFNRVYDDSKQSSVESWNHACWDSFNLFCCFQLSIFFVTAKKTTDTIESYSFKKQSKWDFQSKVLHKIKLISNFIYIVLCTIIQYFLFFHSFIQCVNNIRII